MLRRLIKILLTRKRGDSLHWRRLYERERASRENDRAVWAVERQHLMNQILIKNAASPLATEPQEAFVPEPTYTDEQLEAMVIEQQSHVLATQAAMDDFAFEVAKLNAERDPVWKPIVQEAERLRNPGPTN